MRTTKIKVWAIKNKKHNGYLNVSDSQIYEIPILYKSEDSAEDDRKTLYNYTNWHSKEFKIVSFLIEEEN